MSSLFSHLLLMLAMHSGKMYMPPSFSLWSIEMQEYMNFDTWYIIILFTNIDKFKSGNFSNFFRNGNHCMPPFRTLSTNLIICDVIWKI